MELSKLHGRLDPTEGSMFKVALSCAVAASGILLYGGAASSRTIVVDETRGRYVECYNKE